MRPYEKLSDYYCQDWGSWGTQYVALVSWLENTYGYPIRDIVDVACGIGTLLAELSKRGYAVVGTDLSSAMLARARALNPDVECISGDMATVVIAHPMDLAICSFDSLNYLTSEEHLLGSLRNIRQMIKPGGFFVFDVNTPVLYEERHHGTLEREVRGVRFQQTLSYDSQLRLATTLFDFGAEGQEVHVQKAYCIEELKDQLRTAEWVVLGAYEDFNMVEANEATAKAIFVTRRPLTP